MINIDKELFDSLIMHSISGHFNFTSKLMEQEKIQFTFDELISFFVATDPPENSESFLPVLSPECQPPLDQSLFKPIKLRTKNRTNLRGSGHRQQGGRLSETPNTIPTQKAVSANFAPKQSEELLYNINTVNDNSTFQSVLNSNSPPPAVMNLGQPFMPQPFQPQDINIQPTPSAYPTLFWPQKSEPLPFRPMQQPTIIPTFLPGQSPYPYSNQNQQFPNQNQQFSNQSQQFSNQNQQFSNQNQQFSNQNQQFSNQNQQFSNQNEEAQQNIVFNNVPVQEEVTQQKANKTKPRMEEIFYDQENESKNSKQNEVKKEIIQPQWIENPKPNNQPNMQDIFSMEKNESNISKQKELSKAKNNEPSINAQWTNNQKSKSTVPVMTEIFFDEETNSIITKQHEEQNQKATKEPKINAQWTEDVRNTSQPRMDEIIATQRKREKAEKQLEEQRFQQQKSREPKIGDWSSVKAANTKAPSMAGIFAQEQSSKKQTQGKQTVQQNTGSKKNKNQRGQIIDLSALSKQTTPTWSSIASNAQQNTAQNKSKPISFNEIEKLEQKQQPTQPKQQKKEEVHNTKKKQKSKPIPFNYMDNQTPWIKSNQQNTAQPTKKHQSSYFIDSDDEDNYQPKKNTNKHANIIDMHALIQEEEQKRQKKQAVQQQRENVQRFTSGPRITAGKTNFNSLYEQERITEENKNGPIISTENYEMRNRKANKFNEIEQEEKRGQNQSFQYEISDEPPSTKKAENKNKSKSQNKVENNDDLFWGVDEIDDDDEQLETKKNEDEQLVWEDDKQRKKKNSSKKELTPAEYLTKLIEDSLQDGDDYSEFAEALISKKRDHIIQSLKSLDLTSQQATSIVDKFFRRFPSK